MVLGVWLCKARGEAFEDENMNFENGILQKFHVVWLSQCRECTVSATEKSKVMACMYSSFLVTNHQMSHVSKEKARLVYERVA